MKSIFKLSACIVLAITFVAGTAMSAETREYQKLPAFSTKDLSGKLVSFDDVKGEKATYITFWATWCKPCMAELPHLQELYEKYQEQGLQIIGMNEDTAKKTAKVKKAVNQKKLSYPILLDPTAEVGKKLGMPTELPYGLLIDGNGNIIEKTIGFQKGDEDALEKKIVKLLGLETSTEESN